MNIKQVIINNILSFKDVVINIDDNGLVLIDGWNFDTNMSHGAGKSAIFNSIAFGLFGKLPRDISATEILHRGEKSGFVEVVFYINNDKYSVKRERPNKTTFYKNDDILTINQDEFENIINIDYDSFLLSSYFTQTSGTYHSPHFLLLNDNDKKEHILKLLKISFILSCKEIIDNDIKENINNINNLISKIEGNNNTIDHLQSMIQDEKEIINNINLLQEECDNLNKQIENIILKINSLSSDEQYKLDKLETDINNKRNALNKLEIEKKILNKELSGINRDIDNISNLLQKCPHCNEDILISDNIIIKHDNDAANILNNKKKDIIANIAAIDLKLKNCNKLNVLLQEVQDKRKLANQEFNTLSSEKSNLQASIKINTNNINNLKKQLLNNKKILSDIENLQSINISLNHDLSLKNDEKLILAEAKKVLSPIGISAYVMDSVVNEFNDTVSTYLTLINSNLTYELNTFTETNKDVVKAKFSSKITIDGKDTSLGGLSGGEFKILSIVTDLALIAVVKKLFNISVNPIILDEPFDGLGVAGRELVMKLISALSSDRTIYVIDHATEFKGNFNKIIKVEKRSGISQLVI